MLTLLLYVLIVGLVAALLFLVASALFGRSEELGPLPEGTTVTVLPAEAISGSDVRALRFQQVVRGYKAGEVDWALTRLAGRIDELERQLAYARAGQAEAGTTLAQGVPLAYSTGTYAAGQEAPAALGAPLAPFGGTPAVPVAPQLPEVLPSGPSQTAPEAEPAVAAASDPTLRRRRRVRPRAHRVQRRRRTRATRRTRASIRNGGRPPTGWPVRVVRVPVRVRGDDGRRGG